MEYYNNPDRGLSMWVCPACGRTPCDCSTRFVFSNDDTVVNDSVKEEIKYKAKHREITEKTHNITMLNITDVADATRGCIYQKIGGYPQIIYNVDSEDELMVKVGDSILATGDGITYEIRVINKG